MYIHTHTQIYSCPPDIYTVYMYIVVVAEIYRIPYFHKLRNLCVLVVVVNTFFPTDIIYTDILRMHEML